MATKEDVLAALAAVKSPDGAPLTETGKLSDVVVSDGKVFFSITVDAAVVPQWEPVRKAAEAAVRAVPGVKSAMVALTGERAAGAARAAPPPAKAAGQRARPRARAARRAAGAGSARRRGDRRGRVRQGRRRQIDHRDQSRARPARSRPEGRRARCRHLRPLGAEAARDPRPARDARRQPAAADAAATASP